MRAPSASVTLDARLFAATSRGKGLLALQLLPELADALELAAASAPEDRRAALYGAAWRARALLVETP